MSNTFFPGGGRKILYGVFSPLGYGPGVDRSTRYQSSLLLRVTFLYSTETSCLKFCLHRKKHLACSVNLHNNVWCLCSEFVKYILLPQLDFAHFYHSSCNRNSCKAC